MNVVFSPWGSPASSDWRLSSDPKMPPLQPSWGGQTVQMPQLSVNRRTGFCPSGVLPWPGETPLAEGVQQRRDPETEAETCGESQVGSRWAFTRVKLRQVGRNIFLLLTGTKDFTPLLKSKSWIRFFIFIFALFDQMCVSDCFLSVSRYSQVIVEYPSTVLLGCALVLLGFSLAGLFIGPLPDFSDPLLVSHWSSA